MDSEGNYPYFLQNAKMKVINTCNCFSILYPNISMKRWVADGNKIGGGYCLKGSETVHYGVITRGLSSKKCFLYCFYYIKIDFSL